MGLGTGGTSFDCAIGAESYTKTDNWRAEVKAHPPANLPEASLFVKFEINFFKNKS